MENFWPTCLKQLELELTPQQFSAWIKPLTVLDYEDGKLRMAAPNRFKLDWVKTQFANRITALACEYFERPVEVQFVLDPKNALPKKPATVVPAPLDDAPAAQSAWRRPRRGVHGRVHWNACTARNALYAARAANEKRMKTHPF
jgi:chromosomal replication initiator protein